MCALVSKEPENQNTDSSKQTMSDDLGSDKTAQMEASAKEEKELDAREAAGEDMEDLRRRYLLRRFWHTASRYWTDPHSHAAWMVSGALFAIILLNLAASYAMNRWNRSIFDAVPNKDADTVLILSLIYFVILRVSVCFSVSNVYAPMTLQRRWRKWLALGLVDRCGKSG